ncbi:MULTISPECIES: hypothetical protein [Streptomyces]|uniref:Lipoprotein n=2 Tax=Streptomyces rimosus subsp. rimosus TaxID=132474 RepID=A0A8A1V302_STRR1|nr:MULTISPECIES: hypothetical protein [Streptomyces]MYT41845.1 hypothetical protein [Streptomyces sp. SID5471]KOT41763.1 hypothetical protein ADK84_10380 [Streptomyces sp. NRRL WC-3701]KOT43920.1 hypothetical protein ADK42_06165 [Streptomyces rimosus subsp. rimosus]KOT71125.1 hypothetical protein ADK47_32655 [Streptomyces rimosus subsp. rimosus]QDA02909.1 hypothetical protein CTZ40_03135 [Streptomyces rimosus]
MPSDVVGRITNKVNATRVTDVQNDTVRLEYSAAGGGEVDGHRVTDIATHESVRLADGTETATVKIVVQATQGGDQLVLTGSASGVVRGGSVRFEGVLHARSTTGKFRDLNGTSLLAVAEMTDNETVEHVWRRFPE